MEITLGNWIIYEILFYPGILEGIWKSSPLFFSLVLLIVFFLFFFFFCGNEEGISIKFFDSYIRFRDMRVDIFFSSFVKRKKRKEGERGTFLKGIFRFHFSAGGRGKVFPFSGHLHDSTFISL